MNAFQSRLEDGVAVITFDQPDKPVNTLGQEAFDELNALLAELEANPPDGMVLASAKRSFVAGADINALRDLSRADLQAFITYGQQVMERLAALPFPTVAAINGIALGGGLELALACGARVAVESPAPMLGLPEIKLGLVPGWGGTVRVTQLAGLRASLPMLLAGELIPPARALELGLVDAVVPADQLLPRALQMCRDLPQHRPAAKQQRMLESEKDRASFIEQTRRDVMERTRGKEPAATAMIDVVQAGLQSQHAGLQAERETLTNLAHGPAGRNLIRFFFLKQDAKRWLKQQAPAEPEKLSRVTVINAGDVEPITTVLATAKLTVEQADTPPDDTPSVMDSAQLPEHSPAKLIGITVMDELVELVRLPETDVAVLAGLASSLARTGRTPIVVGHRLGAARRLLAAGLAEVARLERDGVSLVHLDALLLDWGFAQPPSELKDALSDGGARALQQEPGPRFEELPSQRLANVTDELAVQSVMFAMIGEAARLLHERVIQPPDALDLASMLGGGLASWRGGIVSIARALGKDAVQTGTADLTARRGENLAVSDDAINALLE